MRIIILRRQSKMETTAKEYKELLKRVKATQLKLEADLDALVEYNTDELTVSSLYRMSARIKSDREYIRNVLPR